MKIRDILLSGKGRISRRTWWLYSLAYLALILATEAAVIFGIADTSTDIGAWHLNGFDFFMIALCTVGQWPFVCLNAKRWHDRNRSGYFAGIGTVIALTNLAIFLSKIDLSVGLVLQLVGSVYGLWLFVDCGCLPGTDGDNRYGPAPKAATQEAVF